MNKKKSKDSSPKSMLDNLLSKVLERLAMVGETATAIEQMARTAIGIGVSREQFVGAVSAIAGSLYDVAMVSLQRAAEASPEADKEGPPSSPVDP